jgi:hypothetical protein
VVPFVGRDAAVEKKLTVVGFQFFVREEVLVSPPAFRYPQEMRDRALRWPWQARTAAQKISPAQKKAGSSLRSE